MSPFTKVRLSSIRHPAGDLDRFVDSRVLSSQAHLIFPSTPQGTNGFCLPSQSWGFSSVQASLADLLADARLQGAFAVSVPGPAAGVAESESAAVLMDDSVHMRVSRNSYERIGVAGANRYPSHTLAPAPPPLIVAIAPSDGIHNALQVSKQAPGCMIFASPTRAIGCRRWKEGCGTVKQGKWSLFAARQTVIL
mmetsp:Transcript_22107/g.61372  ORF Transcript_22107/g.61372 Transcript_22107/m.61372 type:complete len:194 (-) Transcript_22107:633-1214(-)